MTRWCRYNNKQLLKLLPPSHFANKEENDVKMIFKVCASLLQERKVRRRKIKIYGGKEYFKWKGKFVSNN